MQKKTINGKEYLLREYNAEEIDRLAMRMMEENQIAGLLSFRNVQNPEESYFRYDCKMGASLEEWLSVVHTKSEVLHLLDSIINVSDEVEAYLMDKNRLCTEPDDIIIINDTVHMAYVPDVSYKNDGMMELIQMILPKVKFARDEKYTYIFDLMNAFSRNEITNTVDLKKWLRVLQSNNDNTEEPIIKEEYTNPRGIIENSFVPNVNVPVNERNVEKKSFFKKTEKVKEGKPEGKLEAKENDLFENFFGGSSLASAAPNPMPNIASYAAPNMMPNAEPSMAPNKAEEKKKEKAGVGLFSRKKTGETSAPIITPENEAPPMAIAREKVINEIEYTDRTVIMTNESTAYLVRTRTQETFCLEKRDCEIGRGNTADIVITGNPAIARKQARIYVEEGSYYIIDEGSSNGTCLDGVCLKAGQPYPLKDISRIQFADESFMFELRS